MQIQDSSMRWKYHLAIYIIIAKMLALVGADQCAAFVYSVLPFRLHVSCENQIGPHHGTRESQVTVSSDTCVRKRHTF